MPRAIPVTDTSPRAPSVPGSKSPRPVTPAAQRGAAECDAAHLDAAGTDARRRTLMGAGTVRVLADTFRVLGDPTRVRILDAIADGELCVCDIASLVEMSESAVSHQLRLLRTMRLVRPRRAGRQVFYSVDDHHILELLRLAGTHAEEEPSAVSRQLSAERREPKPKAEN